MSTFRVTLIPVIRGTLLTLTDGASVVGAIPHGSVGALLVVLESVSGGSSLPPHLNRVPVEESPFDVIEEAGF